MSLHVLVSVSHRSDFKLRRHVVNQHPILTLSLLGPNILIIFVKFSGKFCAAVLEKGRFVCILLLFLKKGRVQLLACHDGTKGE